MYANDYGLTAVNIIKNSDICIACPFSTVIFECSYFNKHIFGFDPSLRLKEISNKLDLSYFKDIDDFNKNIFQKIDHLNIKNNKINEMVSIENYRIENLINELKNVLKDKNV